VRIFEKVVKSPWILRCAVAVAGAMCMAPGCNGDVLNDSTFRLWCGATLCDWQLDTGHVNRVPTWHPDDYGVELGDAPTQISQVTGEGSDCMEFSAVADVEDTARVTVEVDYNLDGLADTSVPIAQTGWRPTKALIYGPTYAQRLRFIVRKDGPGRAVLAEIRLQRVTTCTGDRVQTLALDVGDPCGIDEQCATGICCGGVDRVCSTCCSFLPNRACPSGQSCGLADVPPAASASTLRPELCDPGLGHAKKDDACFSNADCASNACAGVTYATASDCHPAVSRACFPDHVRAGKCQ
jgi:hypothetical protein